MQITVYTRHNAQCPHKEDSYSRRCSCNKWLSYQRGGKQIRESAKTRSWDTATKLARKMEREYEDRRLGISPVPKAGVSTIEDAIAAYVRKIGDPKEGREAATLVKPKRMTSLLVEFCDQQNPPLVYLSELTPMLLEKWRSGWTYKPNSSSLKIHDSIVRAFFKWAHTMELIPADPYAKLDKFRVKDTVQTMPLTRDEIKSLLDAIPSTSLSGEDKSTAAVIMRLQRWSGLSIADAVMLRRDALHEDDSLELHRTKTGTPVVTALPHDVADTVRMQHGSGDYFFWDGSGKKESRINQVSDWYRLIFDAAGVSRKSTHGGLTLTHRFRDTFAVEFLLAGGTFEDLSRLLGHKTTMTTHKSYDAWVPTRRDRLVRIARESIEKQQAAQADGEGRATIQ
jgi:integrase